MITRSQVAKKYRMMPGTLAVTYYVKQHSSAGVESFASGVTIGSARRRALSHTQSVSGQFTPIEQFRNWDLWADELGAITPKPGDYLDDPDGVSWYFESLGEGLLDQVKYLTCRKGTTRT